MLRARALVAVRQEQRQARGLAPLGEAGHHELVHDHLCRVHEVAELRLPQHEGVGRLHAVAVLEAHAGALGERAVVELEGRHGVAEVLEGAPALAALGIVEDQRDAARRCRARCPGRSGAPGRRGRGARRSPALPHATSRSPEPSSKALRRRSRNGCSLRCTLKPSDVLISCSLSERRVSSGTVVRGSLLIVRSSSCSPVSGGAPRDCLSSAWASATLW